MTGKNKNMVGRWLAVLVILPAIIMANIPTGNVLAAMQTTELPQLNFSVELVASGFLSVTPYRAYGEYTCSGDGRLIGEARTSKNNTVNWAAHPNDITTNTGSTVAFSAGTSSDSTGTKVDVYIMVHYRDTLGDTAINNYVLSQLSGFTQVRTINNLDLGVTFPSRYYTHRNWALDSQNLIGDKAYKIWALCVPPAGPPPRKQYLEDWDFEIVEPEWGENLYWYHGQAYTNFPDWWCSFLGQESGCVDPSTTLETVWTRYNYSACPYWSGYESTGRPPPFNIELPCFNWDLNNLGARIQNGPAACNTGYQQTDWGTPSINQDFAWDGGVDGTLYWKLAFRGDYRLIGGPEYGHYGTAYAYLTQTTSTTPLYILVNKQLQDSNWETLTGSIANVPAGNYRLWLGAPDGYIVEWDNTGISNYVMSRDCDWTNIPTPTPEYVTNTPNGWPTEPPTTPTPTFGPWTGTPTLTRTPTGSPMPTSTGTRTPGPTRTVAPTISPNAQTATANAQLTQYWQTMTAYVPPTQAATVTPYGTPRPTNSPVPGTPGDSTNTPVPFDTPGLPPLQPTPWNGTGTPAGWNPWGTPLPGGTPMPGGYLVSCDYECVRPGLLEVANWIDYSVCEAKVYTCWGNEHNATAVAIFAQFGTYEPFGSLVEIGQGVSQARTQIAGAVIEGGAAGIYDPIQPSVGQLLKKGVGVDPWAEGQPIINLGPGGDPGFNGYTPYCSTRLSSVLSSRLAAGLCYVLALMRKIGYLPWVQFFINILAILLIARNAWSIFVGSRSVVKTDIPERTDKK